MTIGTENTKVEMAPVAPRGFLDGSKFTHVRPPRPMLARDADSIYWMARYVERAEHIARVLKVNAALLTDVGELAPSLHERQWQSILQIFDAPKPPDGDLPISVRTHRLMCFSEENHNSIVSCIVNARENARGVRENISAEMFEHLNMLYWFVRSEDAKLELEESSEEFFKTIMNGSMLFQGLCTQTLPHEQPWLFTQLAKYLERIDITCRIIETKFSILRGAETILETPLRNIHWMAVLRSCCSIEAFRRLHLGDMDPLRVAAFMILERDYPRSVRFSVDRALGAAAEIRSSVGKSGVDPAERVLGRLKAQLEFAEMDEILVDGLPAYLKKIRAQVGDASLAIAKAYFLH